MNTPAQLYQPSNRTMPDKLLPLEYPDRFEVRYVSANGGIRWKRQWVNVTSAIIGEYVGLEEIDDGLWDVYFGPLKLGRLLERHMRIEDHLGRLKRRVQPIRPDEVSPIPPFAHSALTTLDRWLAPRWFPSPLLMR